MNKLHVTLLETGQPPPAIRNEWPDYPAMFRELLGQAAPELTFSTVRVWAGETLPDARSVQAGLITGSPAGVYEDHAWLDPLFGFIRQSAEAGTPLVGVCFGHQAIAHAMGGLVEKAPQGWGVGRHHYYLRAPDWMEGAGQRLALNASHQDQVMTLPEGADVIAASVFTPYAGLLYRDAPFLSFQGHPEFSNGFCGALYGVRFAADEVERLRAQMARTGPSDGAKVARWMVAHWLRNRQA